MVGASVHPDDVQVGMELWAPKPEMKCWVKVHVLLAADTIVRCVNREWGIDDWYDVNDLRHVEEK